MTKKTGIIQIAQRAGVAPSTVSRVLNNHPDVSDETYHRVKAVIDEVGFLPNASARSLASKRSYTLAMVMSDLIFYPRLILASVEEHARRLGYKLFVNVIHSELYPPASEDVGLLGDLLSYQVDGVIWSVQDTVQSFPYWNQRLRNLGAPVVCIGASHVEGMSFVSVNNKSGGYAATRHLLDQGYQHIGTITGPSIEVAVIERLAGWEEAMCEALLPPKASQVVECDWTPAGGERAIQQLLVDFPELDAVFIQNDQMAIGVLAYLHRLGRNIPDEIGVVGFDNRAETGFYIPPLTSVSHRFDNIGQQVVEEIDRLNKLQPEDRRKEQPRQIWVEPALVVRESSVPKRR